MTTTLTNLEIYCLDYFASGRSSANRSGNIQDRKVDQREGAALDREGLAGEFGWCKLHDCVPDFSLYTRSIKDDTFDAVFQGLTVDIKTTRYVNGQLLVLPSKRNGVLPDVYSLMIGAIPTFRCAGYMRSGDVFQPEYLTNLGRGPTYAVPQSHLLKEFPCLLSPFFKGCAPAASLSL